MVHPKNTSPSWKKNIILFLISQNISLFGSSLVGFAVIWHITLETASGFWLMLGTLCALVPQVLISLWGGVWADRYNRKMLIMLSDGFIALATLTLALSFWMGFRQLELLLIALAVRSLGAGIQTPAVGALIPQLVPEEKLVRIQGINQTLNSVLMLLSPAAGGLILGSAGIVWAFMADVTTAAMAIAVMAFIPVKTLGFPKQKTSFFTELKEGVAYAFGHRLLRGLILCIGCSFFLITPASILTPLMIKRSFEGGVWHLTANELVWTVGSLLGGLYVSLRGEFKDKIKTVALCMAAFGLTFGLLGAAGNFSVYLILMGSAGFFMPILSTAQTVLIQENTQPHMMGRIFSIVQIVMAGAMPAAILILGPLADAASVEIILIVSGGLLILTGLAYQAWNKFRLQSRPGEG